MRASGCRKSESVSSGSTSYRTKGARPLASPDGVVMLAGLGDGGVVWAVVIVAAVVAVVSFAYRRLIVRREHGKGGE